MDFAIGTQGFFNNSGKGREGGDGIHNEIWTRDQLRDYDPGLYNLMLETFPCQNNFIQRCDDDQEQIHSHQMQMNCVPLHVVQPISSIEKPMESSGDAKSMFADSLN